MENKFELEFDGIYGKYHITKDDQIEVKKYRIALLICGITFTTGIIQWITLGGSFARIWLIPMIISLGFALQWIHIYIRFLHRLLKGFWILGCLGIIFLLLNSGPHEMLANLASRPILELFFGPFYAALTG